MKAFAALLVLAVLSACGKAPDDRSEPDIGGNATAGLAFTYGYDFILPARTIASLQEDHAAACEALGTARCRISGLRYTVGRSGEVAASLSVDLAAPIARKFGRAAVIRAEQVGAALAGVEIGGATMVDAAADETDNARAADAERRRIDAELARSDLAGTERAELRRQRAALADGTRAAAGAASDARARIATTPMTFSYTAGRGTGFAGRLADTGETALASTGFVLTALVWLVAVAGPPLLAILLLYLVWLRWGRAAWTRLARPRAG